MKTETRNRARGRRDGHWEVVLYELIHKIHVLYGVALPYRYIGMIVFKVCQKGLLYDDIHSGVDIQCMMYFFRGATVLLSRRAVHKSGDTERQINLMYSFVRLARILITYQAVTVEALAR